MTAKALGELIGQRATYSPADNIAFNVTVTDARQRFGRTDVRIEPESGLGFLWVADTSIVPLDAATS
jgi:hypothetical protein